jgi:hypothetical protein
VLQQKKICLGLFEINEMPPSRNQSNKLSRFFLSHFPLYSEKVLLCGLILNLSLKNIFLPTFFLNGVFLKHWVEDSENNKTVLCIQS